MRFFGAFMLLVLPLFLLVCVKIIKKSDFGDTVAGKIMVGVFYLFSFAAIVTAVYLITLI